MPQTILLAIEWLSVLLILAGALLSVLSAFGLIRLPDVYLRSHAATKSSTLAVMCVLSGVFLYFASAMQTVSINILLGIVFFFITAPVAGHLNGRAAHRSGVPLWNRSIRDELAEAGRSDKAPDANTGQPADDAETDADTGKSDAKDS
ncbi:monovalent cation/H(+) antiporter subunit G [Saccharibacillus sp. CPCC 101409]|uniref:monovalent cation/H(+) antiporter subunit G n=1 Tax=Saccharibacillus sp. CPCC 101409 TaxID=3058041 RepID=UPI0026737C20|nr:monovalent cation/H(+) antiporter subunit G [Saccharibacillus sp. CPCC 101409]MDO3410228.1 monovalent cation/H(+) antiporter subunit G [Saccharibacillus sp. CPCC 101409]